MPKFHDKADALRKPGWLKIRLHRTSDYADVRRIVEKHELHTICSSGRCPNQAECWSRRTATFMILGEICTRGCRFCATQTGRPLAPDADEPRRVAESAALMKLRHVVVTSVTRDDLPDGGAHHWAATVEAVRQQNPDAAIELLIPDFDARPDLLDVVVAPKPDIIGHNIETVERLTPLVRSKATYRTSLETLRHLSERGAVTKSAARPAPGRGRHRDARPVPSAFVGALSRCGVCRSRKIRLVQAPGSGNGLQLLCERAAGAVVVHGRRSAPQSERLRGMKVRCRDLGPMDYAACWELQRTLFEELLAEKNRRRNGCGAKESGPAADKAGTVLLVEHPPVYTLGKSGHAENLLVGRTALEQLGAQFFHIDRGGDITFHGPGQLVCYPILDLERLGIGLREYIGRLEETVIRVVAHYGIAAGRIDGASGVWLGGASEQRSAETERNAEDTDGRNAAESKDAETDGRNAAEENAAEEQTSEKSAKEERSAGKSTEETVRIKRDAPRKICAIGVRSSRYVTMHGFALNVDTDLEWFSRINPCGFSDRGVTSMARETRREVAMEEVKRLVLEELGEQLGVEIRI